MASCLGDPRRHRKTGSHSPIGDGHSLTIFLFTLAKGSIKAAVASIVERIIVTTQEGRGSPINRLMIAGIALAAVAGWGAYAYSSLSSARIEQQRSGQLAALQDYQAQFLSQRKRAEDGERTVGVLQEQLASAQREIALLTTKHSETEASLATARDQLASLQGLRARPALENAPALQGITPLPTKQDVLAAQEALTQLGFGDLKADGVIGPTTRQAIEEFQRVAGLTVTGELHAQTLQSLMRSAKVVAAQNERSE
jgi:murein L,D-transpeptidase YcbB/YkuD